MRLMVGGACWASSQYMKQLVESLPASVVRLDEISPGEDARARRPEVVRIHANGEQLANAWRATGAVLSASPDSRIVIGCLDGAQSLAHALRGGGGPETAARQWAATARAILQLRMRDRARVHLVHCQGALQSRPDLVRLVSRQLGSALPAQTFDQIAWKGPDDENLAKASGLLAASPSMTALAAELQAAAALPAIELAPLSAVADARTTGDPLDVDHLERVVGALETELRATRRKLAKAKTGAHDIQKNLGSKTSAQPWDSALIALATAARTVETGFRSVQRRLPSRGEDDLSLVRGSSLFDAAWYLTRYPDVAAGGMDPAEHYLKFGGSEGRSPGPNFSSTAYMKRYEDVQTSGVNPLVHYLKSGAAEGRKTDKAD